MHFVGFAFQVFKKSVDAKPVLVPFTIPVRRTFEHPLLLRGTQLVPRCVARNALSLRVAHQIILAFLPSRCLHRLDSACAQRQLVVRNHQAIVHPDYPPKTPASFASTYCGVKGEHGGDGLLVAHIALRAMQPSGKRPCCMAVRPRCIRRVAVRRLVYMDTTTATLDGQLQGFEYPRFIGTFDTKSVCHHVQHPALAGGPLAMHAGKSAGA